MNRFITPRVFGILSSFKKLIAIKVNKMWRFVRIWFGCSTVQHILCNGVKLDSVSNLFVRGKYSTSSCVTSYWNEIKQYPHFQLSCFYKTSNFILQDGLFSSDGKPACYQLPKTMMGARYRNSFLSFLPYIEVCALTSACWARTDAAILETSYPPYPVTSISFLLFLSLSYQIAAKNHNI